jgi:hypothetical protein
VNNLNCEDHEECCRSGTDHRIDVKDNCRGDSGDDTMHKRIAEKAHPAKYEPGAHDGRHEPSERAPDEGALLKTQGKRL